MEEGGGGGGGGGGCILALFCVIIRIPCFLTFLPFWYPYSYILLHFVITCLYIAIRHIVYYHHSQVEEECKRCAWRPGGGGGGGGGELYLTSKAAIPNMYPRQTLIYSYTIMTQYIITLRAHYGRS